MREMADAIGREAELNQPYLSEPVHTIYFGGGTPSLLGGEMLGHILQTIRRLFVVDAAAEITLEANPDDIHAESLQTWRSLGINRLSLGVQSFFEEDLQWMNRAHNATQATEAIRLAQSAGFDNITIDLIYGTPGMTDDKWKQNLETALALHVPHLSCYALTVEPKTALAKMIETHRSGDVDADQQARHFNILTQRLAAAGFEHYEISNFARPGYRGRHNSSYWQGKSYLGLGPSAHSFNGVSRQWNVANNSLYLSAIRQDSLPFEKETLSPTQQLNEFIMIRLRTMEGIPLAQVSEKFGAAQASSLTENARVHLQQGHVTLVDDRLVLTSEGKFLADGIAADLFFEEVA